MASISGIGANAANQDTFLQLLVAQLQNQNPLEPVSDTEFIAQLAQFNTLSSLQTLNASFDQLLRLSQLTQGSDLIGKTVQYTDVDGTTRTGLVNRVLSQGDQIFLDVNGQAVGLDQVSAVLA
jgi:flagellar basal-body rod modification protein FlgD